MTKIFSQNRDQIFKAETPEIIVKVFEWSQRSLGVMDDEFVQHTPYLTLTDTETGYDKPPEFLLVGKQSAARAVFGDRWADSIRETQKTPISDLEIHSAEGYLNAGIHGFNYDIVEFDTGSVRGVYRRLIIPVSKHFDGKPTYFAMLPAPVNIEKSDPGTGEFYHRAIGNSRTLH